MNKLWNCYVEWVGSLSPLQYLVLLLTSPVIGVAFAWVILRAWVSING
jgi:hypothetical protein